MMDLVEDAVKDAREIKSEKDVTSSNRVLMASSPIQPVIYN
jgi:hypothetical protein